MKIEKKCQTCGGDFSVEKPDEAIDSVEIAAIAERFFDAIHRNCPQCTKQINEAAQIESQRRDITRRRSEWAFICPPTFMETDEALLPMPEKHAEGLAWKYGKEGVLLFGKTRTGKSRCAWKICERQFMDGKSVMVMNSLSGFEYGSVFATNGSNVLDWVNERNRCGLLFLDDVFKVKLTDSFEAALFAIVDYRLNHKLPIIATLNDTGATLTARMTDDRGAAFVARLKESAKTISFA
jgi:DNA replication protein DnaC